MPTKFALGLAAIVATLIVLRDVEHKTPAHPATSPVEQGLERFDSVLQEGLSQDTHRAFSNGLSDSISESAEFLGAVEASVNEASQ